MKKQITINFTKKLPGKPTKCNRGGKAMKVYFETGNSITFIRFGVKSAKQNRTIQDLENWYKRHAFLGEGKFINNPRSPQFWSARILWNPEKWIGKNSTMTIRLSDGRKVILKT